MENFKQKEEMQKQQEVNIEGKDPITIDCTNPKGGAIPKLGTKEFNNLAMEMFGRKSKQLTAVEWLINELEKHYVKVDLKNTTVFLQAKEIEKQQIFDAAKWYMNTDGIINQDELAEDYYNETFKKIRL